MQSDSDAKAFGLFFEWLVEIARRDRHVFQGRTVPPSWVQQLAQRVWDTDARPRAQDEDWSDYLDAQLTVAKARALAKALIENATAE